MRNRNEEFFLFIIVYLVYINYYKGYLMFMPTLPIYPDNEEDILLLKREIKQRTQQDIHLFYKTNQSVGYAFKPYVDESEEELEEIITSQNFIIYFFKYFINRRRPYQIDKNIKPLNTDTSQTPAYPAGHAYQAILLASHLSKKYPEKKELFDKIALDCDKCRVRAGIHYVSDGKFSRQLFEMFNN